MEHEWQISLLYPAGAKGQERVILSRKACKALLGQYRNYFYHREIDVCDYLTADVETILYRRELFADLLESPALEGLLRELLPLLINMDELYRLRENSHHTEGQLYAIKLIEQYLRFIATAGEGFRRHGGEIRSRALLRLWEHIRHMEDSADYKALRENTASLSREITRVKCVTVGMNLDETFSPVSFGVLGFHSRPMTAGGLMERLLGQGETDGLTALCSLKNTSGHLSKEEKRFADMAVSSALNRLFKSAVSEWEPAVKSFFRKETKGFLPLIGELKFLLFGVELLTDLKNRGLPLAVPAVKPMEEKVFSVRGLYHPALGVPAKKLVANDLTFDDQGMLYLLTGANSGGKTVFLSAAGLCQVFAQLGFLVPAREAEISPVEKILVHVAGDAGIADRGRLEEECLEVQALFGEVTEHSLVLMDEAFSSTDAFEGASIAFDVLCGLSAYGCRGIFSTHLHGLADMKEEINALPCSRSMVDTLTAGTEDGETRTYRISRKAPDGKSHAAGIARRYGLGYEELLKMQKTKQGGLLYE